jgi:hypothetical protein
MAALRLSAKIAHQDVSHYTDRARAFVWHNYLASLPGPKNVKRSGGNMLKMLVGPLLVMGMAAGAVAQDAATRKQFADTVRQAVVKQTASNPVPGFNLAAEGPDSTLYVYHLPGITSDTCRTVLNADALNNLRTKGFTKFVCTDDKNTTVTLDLIEQQQSQPAPTPEQTQPVTEPGPVAADTPGAVARKQFVEKVRQAVVKDEGSNLPPDYNLTVQGPDATIYVTHTSGVTYSLCKDMLKEDFVSGLVSNGFKQLVCTGDGDARFAFDLIAQQQSQPSRSASGTLIVKLEQPRPQPFGFHARMTQQEAIAAAGRSAVKLGYPEPMSYGSVLVLTTAPKPNSSFKDYMLKFSTEGLFAVWADTSAIHSADDGAQVRSEFDELQTLITAKYGTPKCFDFRNSGTSERPDFFMMYLKDKEQHLSCSWTIGHTAAISLTAESLDIETAIISVEYQFYPEFTRAQAGADEKKKDSF